MIRKLGAIALIGWCSVSSDVAAHSGHGRGDGHAFLHYLAELEHALPMIVALLAAGAVVWGLRGRRHGATDRRGRPPA